MPEQGGGAGILHFNSRTSCEVRQSARSTGRREIHFNSRTSCEVRHQKTRRGSGNADFNSRTSCEVRHIRSWQTPHTVRFQLTHLLRGATIDLDGEDYNELISTHAPLARCDDRVAAVVELEKISTHAPLARCDLCSTNNCPLYNDFNSRTSCEVRLKRLRNGSMVTVISTHAPLARCD